MNSLLDRRRAADQQGMTTLGLIILVSFVGLFVYAGLRLIPVYLQDLRIKATFDDLGSEFNGQRPTRNEIFRTIEKRFDIDAVTSASAKQVQIKKTGYGYEVSLDYTDRVPFVANVEFAVSFDHRVEIVR